MRSYPENDLASTILGYVTEDNHGYMGVEEKYDNILAGIPVTVLVPADPRRAVEYPHIPPGQTLILTIDREIQASIEKILDNALVSTGAVSGTIIVMDPKTGEILGLSSTPRMNLNDYTRVTQIFPGETPFNRAISQAYEPGSVAKILTMSAALDNGTVTPGTVFLDTGVIIVGGVAIHDWDGGAWGYQDMTGCLAHSLNVCLAWVSTQMGSDSFYAYMQRFGLGHLTGIDLAGETSGRLKLPGDSDWYPVDLGTNAFGQGVAITPMQMVMAASALANNGQMVYPHVLYAQMRDGHQMQHVSSGGWHTHQSRDCPHHNDHACTMRWRVNHPVRCFQAIPSPGKPAQPRSPLHTGMTPMISMLLSSVGVRWMILVSWSTCGSKNHRATRPPLSWLPRSSNRLLRNWLF